MRALLLRRFGGTPSLETVPEPEAGPGEVVVDIVACGVGLTTCNCLRGDLGDDPALLPVVPGHELVGIVTVVGPGVDEGLLGQRVTAHFTLFCGRCRTCLAAREPLCPDGLGVIGVQRHGGLAERVAIPARNVVPIPAVLDSVDATVVPDAVATPVHVAARAGITAGDRVAVIGAGGGVGVHMVQVAAVHGASVAGLEVDPQKLAFLADELGVPAVDAHRIERAALPAAWGGMADVVVDFVGAAATVGWSLDHLDAGGRLVVVTTFPGVAAPMVPRQLVLGQLSVLGSRYASRAELVAAAALVADGRVRPVIGERADLDGAPALLARLARSAVVGRGVVTVASIGAEGGGASA